MPERRTQTSPCRLDWKSFRGKPADMDKERRMGFRASLWREGKEEEEAFIQNRTREARFLTRWDQQREEEEEFFDQTEIEMQDQLPAGWRRSQECSAESTRPYCTTIS